jgi:hypothetical protein
MARTKLALKTVRVPMRLERALAIKAKFDDLDDLLDALKTTVYSAAGAISPTDGFAIFDSAVAGMAMTLANGTIVGETISYIFRTKTGSGTVVITPTALTGGTTLTLSTAGLRGQLIWTGAAWTRRTGGGGVIA